MVYHDILLNITLLVTLSVLYGYLSRFWERTTRPKQILAGIVFGLMGILVMTTPFEYAPGIFFDTRTIVLSLSGIFAGPAAAGIATLFTGAFRIWTGGVGVYAGLASLVSAAVIGSLAYMYWPTAKYSHPLWFLTGIGIIVTGAMLLCQYLLPGGIAPELLSQFWYPALGIYTPATMLAGYLLYEQDEQIQTLRLLREEETFYRDLFENSPAVMFLIDPTSARIIDANPAAATFYGWSREVLRYKRITDINTLSPQLIQKEMDQARRKHKRYFTFKHQLANGALRDVEVYSGPVRVGDRDLLYSIITDVTDIHRAESRFHQIWNSARDGMRLVDAKGMMTRVNPAFCTMVGLSQEQLEGQPLSVIYQADSDRIISQHQERFQMRTIPEHIADKFVLHNGVSRWFSVTNTYVQIPGESEQVLAVFRDITDRVQTEIALRESEELQRGMLSTSPVALHSIDPGGRVLMWNESCERIFGWTEEDVIGQLLPILPEDKRAEHQSLRSRVNSGEIITGYETQRLRKDGSQFDCRLSAAPMYDADGKVTRIIAAMEDISDQKEAERANVRLQSELLHAQKMEAIGRLAGGVAHDFNNHLTVILGRADFGLHTINKSHKLYETFREIKGAAQRSADLTRQLLSFARRQPVQPEVLDLNATVESMLSMLKRLIGDSIELSWQPSETRWMITMDRTQVDQILANLVVNAKDAIDGQGKVTIVTQNVVVDDPLEDTSSVIDPGEYMMLAVNDTGCGIPEEIKAKIFDPFFTTKSVGEGTGLGLSTIYGIVQQNQGAIQVESEIDVGTTLQLYFPRTTHYSEQQEAPKSFIRRTSVHETILIVEDNPAVLQIVRDILESLGYSVLYSDNPSDAIGLVQTHRNTIDLVITDMMMPGMSGMTLSKKLRNEVSGLKVIFMSGHTDAIGEQDIIAEEVQFISKPFSNEELARKVREVLDTG